MNSERTQSDQERPCISMVLPVYNEAENIIPCLRELTQALGDLEHEILVCYDFDEDSTLAALEAMEDRPASIRLVKNDLGQGPAYAMRAGFLAARGDVVVTTMSDLSDPPDRIPLMARKIREEGAHVVSGSRYMKGGSQTGGPPLKRFLSRMAGLSLCWVAGLDTHDATTNYRAYSRCFLSKVAVESKAGFELGLELTVKAHLSGYRVDEVPSSWTDRSAGQSRFRLWKWLPVYLRWYGKAMAHAFLPGQDFFTDTSRYRRGTFFFTLALVALIAFFRKPDALLNPQFWAEDGVIFFKDALELGLPSLWKPYAGYLHLFPRCVALLVNIAPFSIQPTLYAFASLCVSVGTAAFLFHPRLHLPRKPLLALGWVLVPVCGETFLNLTNVHWHLAPLLVLISLLSHPKNWSSTARDGLLILLLGLTGPFVFFCIPLFAWQCFRRRNGHSAMLLLMCLVAASVQALCLTTLPDSPEMPLSQASVWVEVVGRRLFSYPFLGSYIADVLPSALAFIFSLLLAAFLWTVAWDDLMSKRRCIAFLVFGTLLTGAVMFKFRREMDMLIPLYLGDRYFHLPLVMTLWTLLFGVYLSSWKGWICRGLLLLMALSTATVFQAPPLQDLAWQSYAKRINGEETTRIPIHPQGWFIELRLPSSRRVVLTGPPLSINDFVSEGEVWMNRQGVDPNLVFRLPEVLHVSFLCIHYDLETANGAPGQGQVFWAVRGESVFEQKARNQIESWPTGQDRELRIPVHDGFDLLRLDPHNGPCTLRLRKVELLVRPRN